jgi:hypothetical protein
MARGPALAYIPSPGKGYVKGTEALQAKIAALPSALVEELKPAIDKAAEDFASKVRAVTPVSELGEHPGALRDSVHVEPGRSELSRAVVVDAKATKGKDAGKPFAAHVEYGHKAGDGKHVPPKPFFWPVYAVEKKKIRSAFSRAVTKAVKKVAAAGGEPS